MIFDAYDDQAAVLCTRCQKTTIYTSTGRDVCSDCEHEPAPTPQDDGAWLAAIGIVPARIEPVPVARVIKS